jgi:hypothetical protein
VYFDGRLQESPKGKIKMRTRMGTVERKIAAFPAGSRKSKTPIDVTIPGKRKANSIAITMMGSRKQNKAGFTNQR